MSAIGKTASITLITAVPGSGKTLRAVWWLRKAVEDGEAIFVCNLNGLQLPHCEWDDPKDWMNLPPGSVLVVDEAQRFFRRGFVDSERVPKDADGKPMRGALPDYFTEMETLRHRGIRLILITQQPNYLHEHVLGLVGLHEHLLRENGKEAARIFRHNEVMTNVRSQSARQRYDTEVWSFPKEIYALYKSAEVHTHKRVVASRTKKGIALLTAVGVIVGVIGFMAYSRIYKPAMDDATRGRSEATSEVPEEGGHSSGAAKTATPAPAGSAKPMTAKEYLDRMTPRVAALPQSAPVFDGRQVKSEPAIYCMSSDRGRNAQGKVRDASCTCKTEQGTVYELEYEHCRYVALNGAPYNPFKSTYEEQASGMRGQRQAVAAQSSRGGSMQSVGVSGVVSAGDGVGNGRVVESTLSPIGGI